MSSVEGAKKKSPSSNKLVIVLVVLIVVIIAAAAAIIFTMNGKKDNGMKIGYATEAKVMMDEDSLQAAVDEAWRNAQDGNVALQYQNEAFSSDGKTFSCNIVNAPENLYDMFLTIYADQELTDQVFLSELIPPGSGFEEITLDHALDTGDHTVYVAVTQVDIDETTGEQVIKNQVMHTIIFHVE